MQSVSVIIPCFNARNWIRATLESAIQQQVADLEIIVVDDASTDASADLVEREFPGVRLVRTSHGGPSRARNLGTRLSRGAFIQYLDADDVLAPGKLEAQLEMLERSDADVAYGDWQELRATPDGSFVHGRLVAREIDGDPAIALFTDFWCPPAAYLFRRRIVDRVGGWREELPIIQDARFVLDCALHGAEFVHCRGVAAYYRVHSEGSVSTRDPSAFTRDCMRNAQSIEQWWAQRDGLTSERCQALVKVYGQVARASFGTDVRLFDVAYAALERLQPGYTPAQPWHLAWTSRLVGYRGAESIAMRYRRAKQIIKAGVRP
jgi:glycosyltransferase involved in cell wall biosynthesis